MDVSNQWGAFAFGFVIGWITYRVLRRTQKTAVSDMVTIIGAIGGAAVTGLFDMKSGLFANYSIGLAAGFFVYLIVSLILAQWGGSAAKNAETEWLGEPRR